MEEYNMSVKQVKWLSRRSVIAVVVDMLPTSTSGWPINMHMAPRNAAVAALSTVLQTF